MHKCGCHSHNGFQLSPEGLAQREDVRYGVDTVDMFGYLDKVGSVSGLELERDLYAFTDDLFIDQQYRRFHNGS